MIKTVWKGYLYDGKRIPIIEVLNGDYLKFQATGTGMCRIKGILSENTTPTTIALIRCKDLKPSKNTSTNNVYMCDVSGYQYITVETTGFKNIYGHIFRYDDGYNPQEETVEKEYKAVIILDTYSQMIQIRNDRM